MKSTDRFKETMARYLTNRAKTDEQFAVTFAKPGKTIEDCVCYILNTVQQSGCNGFTDAEIYSMAVHYYDEDNIEAGKMPSCSVVVNHTVELTEEEKAQAKKDAMRRAEEEAYRKITQRKKAPTIIKKEENTKEENNQISLF